MEHAFQLLLFFFIYIPFSYAADFLQNPDFEIPPANTTANSTSPPWLLSEANAIPGWSLNGTVWYVASGDNSSGGHAIQLGPNGKIGQKITATGRDVLHYVLSFAIGAQNVDCADNRTALNITLRDSWDANVSRVIYLKRNSSRNVWERHAVFLGQLGGGDYVHLEIESVATNSSCWPLVDAFAVNRNQLPVWYNGNQLSNGGFEIGPAFVKNSRDGIILNEEQEESNSSPNFYSPLQIWSILGTIRYIDSRHYKVPRGEAAVELLSGDPSGVRQELPHLPTRTSYTLNFTLGDANDSCVGEFIVYVQVGPNVHNFTMRSNGTGSAFGHTLKFSVEPSRQTSLSFHSFNETRTREGLLCGPVLDDIFLESNGEMVHMSYGVLILSLFIAFVMIIVSDFT